MQETTGAMGAIFWLLIALLALGVGALWLLVPFAIFSISSRVKSIERLLRQTKGH